MTRAVEAGTIAGVRVLVEGGEADVAVLRVEDGRFDFADVEKARIEGSQRLTCELTVRDGKVVWDPRGRSAAR